MIVNRMLPINFVECEDFRKLLNYLEPGYRFPSNKTMKLKVNTLWKLNESKILTISKLSKIYLGIPATSVTSERTFSTSGWLISKYRTRLNPELVKKIIFLNKNKF